MQLESNATTMNTIKYIFIILILIVTTSCQRIVPEGDIISKEITFYHGLETINVSNEVEIVLDPTVALGKAVISTQENIMPYVIDQTTDEKLILFLDLNNPHSSLVLKVSVSPQQFSKYDLENDSRLESALIVDKVSVIIELSNESYFKSNINATNLSVNISGESKLELAGECNKFSIQASGDSDMTDYKFITNEALVDLSGDSNIKLTVNNTITGTASGGSDVFYAGNAISSVKLSGNSQIHKISQ